MTAAMVERKVRMEFARLKRDEKYAAERRVTEKGVFLLRKAGERRGERDK